MSGKGKLRSAFLAWQCQIRQTAVREHGGRPSPGMSPRVLDADGRELAPALTVLIVPKEPVESTAFFRYQVQKSHDTREVYERALAYLSADYFQDASAFSDRLLAVLPDESKLAAALTAAGRCVLTFEQVDETYFVPCAVRALEAGAAKREAALWHNRLFNPALADDVTVLSFKPHWDSAGTSR
jgi:hypothetical protein